MLSCFRITSIKCCINTVVSPDDEHNHTQHVEKRNKHTKKNCAPSWLYLQDYTGMDGQHNVRNVKRVCVVIKAAVLFVSLITY